jgi:hypothetical protein
MHTQQGLPSKFSEQIFLARLISHFMDITWLFCLPDLVSLWSYVKSKVNETCPANNDDLKQQI